MYDILSDNRAAAKETAPASGRSGATALQGESGLLRIRVGDYRIIYSIHDAVLTVLVVTFGHRRDVYQRR